MSLLSNLGRTTACALLAASTLVTGLTVARATERVRDHVYADSYGNLVIYSRAGYKRIVVGKGYLAEELSAELNSEEGPAVVRADDDDYRYQRDCYRAPAFVQGRSYMYGLADGEMPQLSPCVGR